jgi:hypothetical protein
MGLTLLSRRITSQIVVVGVAAALFAGCGRPAHVMSNHTRWTPWIRNTQSLLLNSGQPGGGYSILNIDEPTSWYDTYYNVQLLRYLKQPVPNQRRLAQTLLEQPVPKSLTGPTLTRLYYTSQLDHLLHVNVPNKYRTAVSQLLTQIPSAKRPVCLRTQRGSSR